MTRIADPTASASTMSDHAQPAAVLVEAVTHRYPAARAPRRRRGAPRAEAPAESGPQTALDNVSFAIRPASIRAVQLTQFPPGARTPSAIWLTNVSLHSLLLGLPSRRGWLAPWPAHC